MNEFDFIMGIEFYINDKKVYIYRELEMYYNDKIVFDKKAFYRDNFVLFKNTSFNIQNKIVWGDNVSELKYLLFSNIKDITNPSIYFSSPTQDDTNRNTFFIDGGKYKIYDNQKALVKTLYFAKRKSNFGYSSFNILEEQINFILFPNKIIHQIELEKIINKVEIYFPGSNHSANFEKYYFSKSILNQENLHKLLAISKIIETSQILKQTKIEIQRIKKKNFNPIIHELNEKIINCIVERGGFGKIDNEEEFEIESKLITIDNEENRYLLESMLYLQEKMDICYFDEVIINYKKKNIGSRRTEPTKISQKLLSHPVYANFVKLVESLKKGSSSKYQFEKELGDQNYDQIKSLNELYEIFCYIKFYEFLSEIGFDFFYGLSDRLYDIQSKKIIKYEDDCTKGYVQGNYQEKEVKLYYGDKIFPKIKRHYGLMDKSDFGFIDKCFSRVTENGLTPDITLEIKNKLIICDVKFSCFKDFDSSIDYPNTEYLIDIQKYRKIIVNGEYYNLPIIIFFPGEYNLQNIEQFKKMHNLIMISFRVFLFPLLSDNQITQLFIETQFKKYFLS